MDFFASWLTINSVARPSVRDAGRFVGVDFNVTWRVRLNLPRRRDKYGNVGRANTDPGVERMVRFLCQCLVAARFDIVNNLSVVGSGGCALRATAECGCSDKECD